MNPLTPAEIAEACGGRLTSPGSGAIVRAVGTDTRSLPADSLFVALRGPRHDGHDFLDQATASGAVALLIEEQCAPEQTADGQGPAVITVADTLAALQQLATACRRHLAPLVVGVTGSNGKTTVKEFVRAVLEVRHQVNATQGNLNNHIGLPLSMLSLEQGQTHAVWELGMNQPGEIAALAALAQPDIALVTNIGRAHIGNLGSLEAIAREKFSLYHALRPDGIAILNLDCPYAAAERGAIAAAGIRTLGATCAPAGAPATPEADLRGRLLDADNEGCFLLEVSAADNGTKPIRLRLPLPGPHMGINALLAIAAGMVVGVSLEESARAIEQATIPGGRLRRTTFRGATLLDDSYNANPDSLVAALNTLAAIPSKGRRIAILGAMGELGKDTESAYREAGFAAHAAGVDIVATVAADSISHAFAGAGGESHAFDSHEACAAWLADELTPADVALVKGSRAAAMENILAALSNLPARKQEEVHAL